MEANNTSMKEDVIQKLHELTAGLLYMSESDYPLEVVQYKAPSANELTKDEVLALVNQPPGETVEIRDLHYFFRNVTKPVDETNEAGNVAKRFQVLQAFLEQHLQQVKVYGIGKRNIQTYVLGKLNDGTYTGVKTIVISPS